ncbi:hypothetical protein DICPUDRAFT_74211 [Dictyostelium purpureum]|uniref:B box-type domain-containing protein n=1 Tax=Dictyostelium purpureum TaxID=5786 RepID=F0Z739_DICPU|nr:uncharacterized protein DICPUDRAFT_74211 [Dictyostelium purpureum]EGC40270.1 hypothetical protein DICPUDRAFT_74211 [Dictyostelium purpureum]|eukprot:XP_003283206.1 hypothetical protein DICPUDRAFT_74211 [Dictyostelium purpureum]
MNNSISNLKRKKFNSEGNLQELLKQELTFDCNQSTITEIEDGSSISSGVGSSSTEGGKIIDCLIHGDSKIEFICDDCQDKPICKLCLSGYHKGHRVSILDDEKTKSIINTIKENNILSTLNPIRETNDQIMELAKKQLEASELKKESCKNIISSEFKKLYEMFKVIEEAKIQEMEESQKKNLEAFNTIQNLYNEHQNVILPIEEACRLAKKDSIELNDLEIIKFNHQVNELLKKPLEFQNLTKISLSSNQFIIDTMIESSKKLFVLKESKFKNNLNNSTSSNSSNGFLKY